MKDVIEYSKTRILFGKLLAATQAIQIRLAEMARKITTSSDAVIAARTLERLGIMQPTQVSVAKWYNCARARLKWRVMRVTFSAARH